MTEICLTRNATSLLRDVEHAYAVGEKVAGLKPVFSQGAIDPFRVFRSHRVIANDIVEGEDVVGGSNLTSCLERCQRSISADCRPRARRSGAILRASSSGSCCAILP
jgi:hypothetical protein